MKRRMTRLSLTLIEWGRRRAIQGLAVVLVAMLLGLGIAAATFNSDGSTSSNQARSRVCSETEGVVQAVRRPLQAGDIQGTVQAAQAGIPRVQSLLHQPGLSPAVASAVNKVLGTLEGTASGSAASFPAASRQLAAACRR